LPNQLNQNQTLFDLKTVTPTKWKI